MDVLYDYGGYVDIESPVFMNEKQVEKFVQGLKNIPKKSTNYLKK